MRRGHWAVPPLAVLLLTGCTVALPDPDPDPATAALCSALLADLPDRVLGQGRRNVTPGRLGVAWGRPAITLRCGVPHPPGLTEASACLEVNGVGWFDEPAEGGRLYTTIGRPAFVELAVPAAYAPEAQALTAVAAAIQAHDPARQPCR